MSKHFWGTGIVLFLDLSSDYKGVNFVKIQRAVHLCAILALHYY